MVEGLGTWHNAKKPSPEVSVMTKSDAGSAGSRGKRRWFQYSLRTFLLLTTLVAWWLGVTVQRAREQQQLADAVRGLDGVFWITRTRAPEWLVTLIGEHYLTEIDGVQLGGMTVGEGSMDTLGNYARLSTIGDSELEEVAQLPAMHGVTTLFLAGTVVTDAGLKHLTGLSNLRVLDVGFTQVSEKGMHDLQESLPECEIVHNSYGANTSARRVLSTFTAGERYLRD